MRVRQLKFGEVPGLKKFDAWSDQSRKVFFFSGDFLEDGLPVDVRIVRITPIYKP